MTKAQQLALVVLNIIPRIQADVDALKSKGNESAMIDRIYKDLDLMQVICGGVANDQID
jgi:hypothetical protein